MPFITPGEGVALTLAARYGHRAKQSVEPKIRKSSDKYVRTVGQILVNESQGKNKKEYLVIAKKLADRAAASPITIEVIMEPVKPRKRSSPKIIEVHSGKAKSKHGGKAGSKVKFKLA
jgi:hypothetical protein